jgi:hypothetical protein
VDRDIFLLLAGAVIAAVINILMRLLETFVRHIAKRLYFARSDKLEKKKIKQKLMGLDEDNSYKPDFWLELWADLGKMRGGGGTKYSHWKPIDYAIVTVQWMVTIGIFIYWIIYVIPQMK